jgi:basic membrane lipoprotein Med (substrate-binding protein (PBP1-ABC) superfamily)
MVSLRRGGALGAVVLITATACGGRTVDATAPSTTAKTGAATRSAFRVGLVGPVRLDVPGVAVRRGSLDQVAGSPLVLVSARVADAATVQAAARAHPASRFALLGGSTEGHRAPNLVGLVLRDDQAALLAGIVAGLVAADEGGETPRVAWVGPEERRLAAAFGRGVHRALPGAAVLHQWSKRIPARCKEAALIALARGAVAVMADGGLCAEAAASAAHEQNVPALRLGDFELPGVAVAATTREASRGVFHGGGDVVFGAATGAVGIRFLDPRIPLPTATRARSAAQELAGGPVVTSG